MLAVKPVIPLVHSCPCARPVFVALLFVGAMGCSLNPQPLPPHTEPGGSFDEADAAAAEKVDDAGTDGPADATQDGGQATDASGDS
jgi:hypothetical protein